MLHGSLTDEKKLVEEDYDALDAFEKPYKLSRPLFKKVILSPNLWIYPLKEAKLYYIKLFYENSNIYNSYMLSCCTFN